MTNKNMDVDLTSHLIQKFGTKTRKIGRYSVSDLYAIFAGWTNPEHFFEPQINDFVGIKRMWAGVINHDFIESLLEKEKCEQKIVYKYRDIEIVGKIDYLPNEDEVWDFKTSDRIMEKMKPWNGYQIKCYCSMFNRKFGKIYQPVLENNRYILKHMGTVERSDEWFLGECQKLYKFHEKLVEMQKTLDK